MGLEEIRGLCCRFLLSADGDVVTRLTESVCVTFRNGGRRAVGRNHFTPSSRESGSNIDNYTIFFKILLARGRHTHLQLLLQAAETDFQWSAQETHRGHSDGAPSPAESPDNSESWMHS